MAYDILAKAEKSGNRVDEVLHGELKTGKLTAQDRRFITRLVMGTTRMRGRLDSELATCYNGRYTSLEHAVKRLLRFGGYQLRYMDSVPPYAAIDTTVTLARDIRLVRAAGLVNAVLRDFSRRPPQEFSLSSTEEIAAAYSHPEWLVERWLDQWGQEKTVTLMDWNNLEPTLWFRMRKEKGQQQFFRDTVHELGLSSQSHPHLHDYVTVNPSPAPLLEPEYLARGSFIVQDPSSGAIVEAVDPQPGESIIDLCAGPGGKTALLADAVGSEGYILAYEIDHQRVAMINDTVNRLELNNVDIYPGDATGKPLPKVNKILVDAPCMGTGVMARRADLRWRRQPENLGEMTTNQFKLLQHAARYLNAGGSLIYATCSLEDEENWKLIQNFQNSHPNFYIDPMPENVPQNWIDSGGALCTFPPDDHVDGVFAVRLKKS
ncbi:16S rRNA (cytosine(967)-C(5))-methyltransferase RsmB [Candidatus Neomarinimicrobiota bacterium]